MIQTRLPNKLASESIRDREFISYRVVGSRIVRAVVRYFDVLKKIV